MNKYLYDECDKIIRTKRHLSNDSNTPDNVKKLKPVSDDMINLVILQDESEINMAQFKDNDCQGQSTNNELGELKSLVRGLAGTMNNFCEMITKCIDDFENNIPNQIASMIDKKVTIEIQKFQKQFQTEIKGVTEKVECMEKSYADIVKQASVNMDIDNSEKCRIVIRNIPESSNENLENKINGLIRDGLHLKDVKVVSAERKKSFREGKSGVIIASLSSTSDKRKVMDKKRELKNSRNYKDVFVENSIPLAQRILNSNLRNIVNAIGDDNLEVKGIRVQFKSRKYGHNKIVDSANSQSRDITRIPENEEINRESNGMNRGGYNKRGR
ncbi:unnamed protein product [Mytilus edulis]|uniref:Uncharacterized protein n=1 Tax=Mytilus edulis TaxID=6550 RepID=A0A8S3VCW9_MYTED|nr:unnamed protein product [Mytilus edulis]